MANSSSLQQPKCYPSMPAVSNGILQGDLPVNFALPLLTLQIAVVLVVTRFMAMVFQPIKQPRVLAEIIGGVLLGPTALGRNKLYLNTIFPPRSIPLLETVATVGLMFFIFMVGLELDLKALKKTGKKALLIAAVGIMVPFIASTGLANLVHSTIGQGAKFAPLVIFMGAPISISAFSVLVRIMAELKLLSTDIAKLAIPIAAVNDVTIWTLLAVGVAIAGTKKNPLTPIWVILCAVGFGVFMFTIVRKFMDMVAHRATRQAGQSTDIYVCVTLMGVLAAGFCSDAVGVHALLGPFLLGLVLPKDNPFPKLMTEKIEDFVTSLFLPLFFASSGLKTNLGTLHGVSSLGFLVLFFCTATCGKIAASFATARIIGLPNRRALILGFLLNTKGLAVLIVLNIGRDLKALTDELFAILVLTALLTSFVTTPVVTALVKPGVGDDAEAKKGGRRSSAADQRDYAHRSLASLDSKHSLAAQLRILACAYEPRHHAAFLNLLEASRGSKTSPIKLYPLRLSLLSERPSSIFMLTPAGSHDLAAADIVSATSPRAATDVIPTFNLSFPSSPLLSKVIVRPLSTISKLDSMHEDICKLGAQKRSTLIILPYQKSLTHVNHMHMFGEPSFYKVNQKVLDHAPCSIGILVEKGSLGVSPIHPSFFSYNVVVLFVGGPDDREALFLGSRMIDHAGVSLKVVRFTTSPNSATNNIPLSNNDYSYDEVHEQEEPPTPPLNASSSHINGAKEKLLDEEAIAKIKERSLESSLIYEEEHIASGKAFVETLKNFAKEISDANMVIVGRGRLRPKLNTTLPNQEHPNLDQQNQQLSELGMIGDILASSGIEFHACILVVQQHYEYKDTHNKDVNKIASFERSSSPCLEISAA